MTHVMNRLVLEKGEYDEVRNAAEIRELACQLFPAKLEHNQTTVRQLGEWLDRKLGRVGEQPRETRQRWLGPSVSSDKVLAMLRAEMNQRSIEAKPGTKKMAADWCQFDAGERSVLKALLAAHPLLLMQYELETNTEPRASRRTIGWILRTFRSMGLTHRPNGDRSGEGLTAAGLAVAKNL